MSDVLYELPLPWPLNAHTSNTLFVRNWAYHPFDTQWRSFDIGYQCSNVQAGSPFTGFGWTDFNNLLEILYFDLQQRMFSNPQLMPSIPQPVQFINGSGQWLNTAQTVTGMSLQLINAPAGLDAESGPPILYQAGKWGLIQHLYGGGLPINQNGFNYINWSFQSIETNQLCVGAWWHLEPGVNAFLYPSTLDPAVKLSYSTDGGATFTEYIGAA